jgi:hypothetical protein
MNRRVGGCWIQITNVGSIPSTAADHRVNSAMRIKEEGEMSAPPSFSRQDEEIYSSRG